MTRQEIAHARRRSTVVQGCGFLRGVRSRVLRRRRRRQRRLARAHRKTRLPPRSRHRLPLAHADLTYDNPAVRREILDIMSFWLDHGIDGFRVDAIPYLYEREGTSCENLSETHTFCQEMRQFVESRYPGALLLAEANQWPDDL